MDVTLNLANPLAGSGSIASRERTNLHGWGAAATPDATLYTVRGFDATDKRFLYDVNPRFGSTSPAATTLRAPFRLTLDVSWTSRDRCRSSSSIAGCARGARDARIRSHRSGSLAHDSQRTVPDPYAELLQQTDSLLLSDAQAASDRSEADRAYRARVDSMWTDLATYLATLAGSLRLRRRVEAHGRRHDAIWEITRLDVQARLRELLSPAQQAVLGGWAGQLFRARDRVHVRLAPRAG